MRYLLSRKERTLTDLDDRNGHGLAIFLCGRHMIYIGFIVPNFSILWN